MNDVAFSEPVILHLPGIGDRKVAMGFEAIECLHNEWPQWARGRSWRSAQRLSRRTRWMVWREDSTTKPRQSREPGERAS